VFDGREGLTVAMRNGLLVYFGNDTRPHAKWTALARVLAAPSSAGAWYVDVRVPERPAAGIAGGGTSTPAQASASDPTAAALAASLAAAVGGGSSGSEASSEASSEAASSGSSTPTQASGPEASGSGTGSSEASTEAAGSSSGASAPPATGG